MIKKCLVTVEDVDRVEANWGKGISFLKGTTVRKPPESTCEDYVEIPKELMEKHWEVTLCINMIWINGIKFLNSIGYPMYYR